MRSDDIHLLGPRYWPVWLGFGLMRLLIMLPYRLQLRLGRRLGRLALGLFRSRRRIAFTNLAACFPELSDAQRQDLLVRHFESLGMSLFEIAMAWWKPDRALRELAQVQGLEHLDAALAEGRGVILFSAHFTCLELTGRLLALFAPFHAMYRRHDNAAVEYVVAGVRNKVTSNAIQSKNVRAMIRSLRQGNAVWYASDRNSRRKLSIFTPFFGHLATTNTAVARIPASTGALLVPFHGTRRPDGKGYDLILEPALANFPSGNMEADVLRTNQLIETWVRSAPEQYLWIHRRFRSRPNPDDPPFY